MTIEVFGIWAILMLLWGMFQIAGFITDKIELTFIALGFVVLALLVACLNMIGGF